MLRSVYQSSRPATMIGKSVKAKARCLASFSFCASRRSNSDSEVTTFIGPLFTGYHGFKSSPEDFAQPFALIRVVGLGQNGFHRLQTAHAVTTGQNLFQREAAEGRDESTSERKHLFRESWNERFIRSQEHHRDP